ncbi:MAG: hypothetical protein H9535_08215 [Ignavibacteria bacterium]|nr:hypothetical protein [Ignavibacteria bacterium]
MANNIFVPAGSYSLTSKDIYVTLHANCADRQGNYVPSHVKYSVADAEQVVDIENVNGVLTLQKIGRNPYDELGQYVPAGTYQHTSKDIFVTLEAVCKDRKGVYQPASTVRYSALDAPSFADIENINGVLVCDDNLSPIFQLTAVSQNDGECSQGENITAIVTSTSGVNFWIAPVIPPSPYPATQFPYQEPVKLPIPGDGKPSPTWFFKASGKLADASVTIEINTPNQPVLYITIEGDDLVKWGSQNFVNPSFFTNQVYQTGSCGVFGLATSTQGAEHKDGQALQPVSWIYTITTGVNNPQTTFPK